MDICWRVCSFGLEGTVSVFKAFCDAVVMYVADIHSTYDEKCPNSFATSEVLVEH